MPLRHGAPAGAGAFLSMKATEASEGTRPFTAKACSTKSQLWNAVGQMNARDSTLFML